MCDSKGLATFLVLPCQPLLEEPLYADMMVLGNKAPQASYLEKTWKCRVP